MLGPGFRVSRSVWLRDWRDFEIGVVSRLVWFGVEDVEAPDTHTGSHAHSTQEA